MHQISWPDGKAYEVAIEDGKLLYKQTGEFIDTTRQTKGAKWIFVLSATKTLYVGVKKKGLFQHSSFLSGGATLAAGRIVAENGVLKAVWPHSGHYHPTQENFQDFISFLQENGVDTSYVKMDSNEDDDKEYFGVQSSNSHVRTSSSESEKEHLESEDADLEDHFPERTNNEQDSTWVSAKKPRLFDDFARKLNPIVIPTNDGFFVKSKTENQDFTSETMLDGFSDDEHDPKVFEPVSKESILQRINSRKEAESFQLGKQLSCKWSTGAGPRIGCLRDYPTELQSHALEQASLSPRTLRSFDRRNSYRTRSCLLTV